MKSQETTVILIPLILIYLWVSADDHKHEEKSQAHYETMVCLGHWQDYKNVKPDCLSSPDADGP